MSNGRPTAKRSPSILVTDARTNVVKGARAPFAGHSFRKQQQQQQQLQQLQPGSSGRSESTGTSHGLLGAHLHRRFTARATKYADISVDKLLSNSSDIPSGQSRLPLLGQNGGTFSPPQRSMSPTGLPVPSELLRKRNIRLIPKLSQNLPTRTSKNSQRLVLIPEEPGSVHVPSSVDHQQLGDARAGAGSPPIIQRSKAELMPKEARAKQFSRVTAYYICEDFNLAALADFVAENHEVQPRLYDEALYVPYTLPLLPGTDGFRVKSNDLAKSLATKRYMDKMIAKSEQTDHLYEYYLGVETPEDAHNYSMDPQEGGDSGNFDPSEPQFFAPPDDSGDTSSNSTGSDHGDDTELNTRENQGPKTEAPQEQNASENSKSHAHARDRTSTDDYSELQRHHAEMFVLEYGIVVFWNLSETHEKNILADLAFSSGAEPLLINPISEHEIETEEFHFEYDPQIQRPRIYNDMITLRSGDHLIKLAMSHAIAQLTKLCLFESRMVHILLLILRLPKKLALTGRLGLKRKQLMKKSGRLFKLRVDVNLSSSILDTPGFFWSLEPALHPLYSAVREYLEIEQRVQVLNDRCKVFLEFTNIISDSINESSTTRITMMIIIIIFISLLVSVFEFFLDIL